MAEQCEMLSNASHALLMASQSMMPKTIKAVIEEGADIDAKRCGDGYSALLLSAWNGHFPNVKVLVENGANINIESNNEKATAVMLAAQQGFDKIVAYLIKKGADLNRQATTGETALSVAEEHGHEKIVKLIKKNM